MGTRSYTPIMRMHWYESQHKKDIEKCSSVLGRPHRRALTYSISNICGYKSELADARLMKFSEIFAWTLGTVYAKILSQAYQGKRLIGGGTRIWKKQKEIYNHRKYRTPKNERALSAQNAIIPAIKINKKTLSR